MQISYRDFIDRPFVHGWVYFKQIPESTSLARLVTHVALTILLWTPPVNIAVHLILKAHLPSSPLEKLPPHLTPMSADEKARYAEYPTEEALGRGTFDYGLREARFGRDFERVALMKVNNRAGSHITYDVRKVDTQELGGVLYCPFQIHLFPENRTYISSPTSGWLILSHSEGAIYINRIDNFAAYNGIRLGSALVQFAIEMSLKAGYGGKVRVRSTNGSAGFYYRLGFVCGDPVWQKKIEQEYQMGKKNSLDGGDMFLPPEAIAIWKQKIAQMPITVF